MIVKWLESAFNKGLAALVVGFVVTFFGCCKQTNCCPQCRYNLYDINAISQDLLELDRTVEAMKRGYVTIPVTVTITNAWEGTR